MAELQQALDMPTPPARIECYDISHTQGIQTVGSMVVFVQGVPKKSDYRRFNVTTVGNDDYGAMKEVLTRRFQRYMIIRLENFTIRVKLERSKNRQHGLCYRTCCSSTVEKDNWESLVTF